MITPPSLAGDDGESSTPAKVTFVEVLQHLTRFGSFTKASAITPYRLVISLQTGTIQLMDQTNVALRTRCLNNSNLHELKNILAGASVCAKSVDTSSICAAVYTPGYASLFTEGERINLGESRDSCGTGRKDLCGDLNNVFAGYIANVKQHWSEMNCQ